MVLAWESVREDICRHYSMEGKSLTQVKAIMMRDKGFNASFVILLAPPILIQRELI